MSKQYDQKLKEKIINEKLIEGKSARDLSSTYGIAVSTIHKWLIQKPSDQKLINVTHIIKPEILKFDINGYEITCDESMLTKILNSLRK